MKTFEFQRWNGSRRRVKAEYVTFEPSGHVAFWIPPCGPEFPRRTLVLAERTEQVNELHEVVDE